MMLNKISILVLAFIFDKSVAKTCEIDDDCNNGKFCGTDKQCHQYNCRFWWEFGHWRNKFTDIPNNLSCKGVRSGVIASWNQYCGGGLKRACEYCSDPSQDDVIMPFTRSCEGKPGAGKTFLCYDYAGNTDFTTFERKAALAQFPCENPLYRYQIHYDIDGASFTPHKQELPYFDIAMAYSTLQASINPTPTPAPTYEATSILTSSSPTIETPGNETSDLSYSYFHKY